MTTPQSLLGAMAEAVIGQFSGVKCIYKLFVDAPVAPGAGTRADRYHDVPIRAMVDPANVQDVVAGGPVQVGDMRFLFPKAVVSPFFTYAKSKGFSTSDLIVDEDGVQWRVVQFQELGSGTMVRAVARRGTK